MGGAKRKDIMSTEITDKQASYIHALFAELGSPLSANYIDSHTGKSLGLTQRERRFGFTRSEASSLISTLKKKVDRSESL